MAKRKAYPEDVGPLRRMGLGGPIPGSGMQEPVGLSISDKPKAKDPAAAKASDPIAPSSLRVKRASNARGRGGRR